MRNPERGRALRAGGADRDLGILSSRVPVELRLERRWTDSVAVRLAVGFVGWLRNNRPFGLERRAAIVRGAPGRGLPVRPFYAPAFRTNGSAASVEATRWRLARDRHGSGHVGNLWSGEAMSWNSSVLGDAAKSIIKPSRAEPSRAEPSRAERPQSCPPGRVMPRLSGCRSGRPPNSLPAAPCAAQSDPLPEDPGAAPPRANCSSLSRRRTPELSGAPDRARPPETPLPRTRNFPRGRRRARVVPLLLACVAVLAAGSASAQTTDDDGSLILWEATLTVGESTGGSLGYSDPSGFNHGTLSSNSFIYAGSSRTVFAIASDPTSFQLRVKPKVNDITNVTLHIDSERLALADGLTTIEIVQWGPNLISWSKNDSVAVKLTQAQAPPAPRLSAQGGSTRIDLSWSGKTGGSDITGYRIEVSIDGTDGSWTDLVESTTDTTYSHTGLSATARRYYRVTATNAIGTGPTSSVVWATPVAQPVDVSADGTVFGKVVWTATMTTAQFTSSGLIDFTGFSDLDSEGSLNPDEFVIPAGIEYGGVEYGGLTFGFDLIGWRDADDPDSPNTLYMTLKIGGSPCGVQHHPATAFPDWALHVGGRKLRFADLLVPSSEGGFCLATFYWDNVDLPWTGSEMVELKITSGETGAYPELLPVQDATVAESGDPNNRETTMTFTVSVDLEPDFPVGVHYKTEDVDATGGASCSDSPIPDYISTKGRLTFGPGETSHEVEVTVCDDSVADSGETFRLVLKSTQLHESIEELEVRGTIREYGEDEETESGTGTITNDETTTEVSITADAAYAEEGTEAGFTLRRTGDAVEALTVPVSVVEDGAALGTPVPESVTFEAGSSQAALRVPTEDDGAKEADSTVTATLEAGLAWQVAEDAASAALTVLDNDAAPVAVAAADVTVWSADMTVVEYSSRAIGAGSADLFSNQSGRAGLRARWLWYDPSARKLKLGFDAGLDDAEALTLHVGGVSLGFPDNTGGNGSFTLEDVDLAWTDGETVAARVSKPSAQAVSTDATLASLTVAGATLSPAFDTGVLVYRAAVDAETERVTVAASATDDGAVVTYGPAVDADPALADHQVAAPVGETLATVTVTAADGQTQRAYRVVVKRWPTVAVSFRASSHTATEGGEGASVIVELGADPGRDVTIPLTATPAGGAAAEDYTVPASVTFAGGGALSRDVEVTAVADDTAEEGESVVLGFGDLPDGVEAGTTASAAVNLADTAPQAVNTEPAGSPTIDGTPEVGETLTASVDGIEDGDGLDNATFAYRWLADDAAIDGGSGTTYEVGPEDVGKALKVRVTFTDDKGTAETLVSAATEAVVDRRPVVATLSVGAGAAEAGRFRLRIAFAGAVTGLAFTDVTAARVGGDAAAVSNLAETETGRVWTAWVAAADSGRYTVRLAAGAAASGERRSLASVLAVDVDAAGNATAVAGPVVTSIALAMAPDGGWTDGDAVRVTLAFSEPVTVATAGGTPAVGIDLAGGARQASFASGSGTSSLAFSYAVAAEDGTVSAVTVTADSLALNGGTIRDAGGRDADLDHPGVGEAAADEAETESVSALTGLKLVDPGSGAEAVLADADALVLEDPANGSYGLVASVSSEAQVGSVVLALTGAKAVTATDDAAPYSLYGDEDGTVTGAGLPAGSYTLTATAYRQAAGGGAELGTLSVSFTVVASAPVDPDALTASFTGMPTEHGGGGESNRFPFELAFSENPKLSYVTLRDDSFAVTGGDVKKAKRKTRGSNQHWTITVEPDGWGDVSLILPGGRTCGTEGAICTADDKVLANTSGAVVPGPLALSVADASATEGAGAVLAFEVTLSRAASGTVTVDYATADGTATAGADYTATSGTLTFDPGETPKTVNVAVLDDAHDDDGETLTLTLSNASGARIRDGEATGTIENSDAIPQAWLARFGRTVADHVVDAIGTRLTGPAQGGSQVTLGGQRMALDGSAGGAAPGAECAAGDEEAAARDTLAAFADRIGGSADGSAWDRGADGGRFGDGAGPDGGRSMTGRELLLGSSFVLNLSGDGEDGAGAADTRLAAWGRAVSSRFDGEADGLALDGDVTTFTLGADAARGGWLAGVAVSLSEGTGGFRVHEATDDESRAVGTLESTLTSVHPYARLQVSERLMLWGLLGYGTGELELALEGGERWTSDTTQEMAAVGARGVLVKGPEAGGFELGLRGDAVVQRMRSEAVTGSHGGNLAAADAQTSRVRLALEGSRSVEVGDGGVLTPTLEAGLRQDGGDAETGTGIEVGGGLAWADPALGLTVEAKARTLIAHEDADYREWGASGSVRIDPGASGRGLSLTLAPAWGAGEGGAERLWGLRDARGLAPDAETRAGSRLEAELGYGFAVLDGRGVATPFAGLSRSETGETLRLGQSLRMGASEWRFESAFGEAERAWGVGYGYRLGQALDLSVEATRREAEGDDASEHGVMLRLGARW